MEINICPSCGAVFKPKSRDCAACGAVQSRLATTVVATSAGAVAPMVVSVAPDRLILERIVTNRQLNALVPSGYYTRSEDYGTEDYANEFYDAFGGSSSVDEFNNSNSSSISMSEPQDFFGSNAQSQINQEPAAAADSQYGSNGNTNGNGSGNGNGNAQNQDNYAAPAVSHPSGIENFSFTAAPTEHSVQSPFFTEAEGNPDDSFDPNEGVARDDSEENPDNEQSFEPPQLAPPPVAEQNVADDSRSRGDFFEGSPSNNDMSAEQEDQSGTQVTPTVAPPAMAPANNISVVAPVVAMVAAAAPTRPQVAGPQDPSRAKSDSTTKSAPMAARPTTAEAFDFFQSSGASSSAPSKPAKAAAAASPTEELSSKSSNGDDPHSSFETLLSKSSKSGNYKSSEAQAKEGISEKSDKPASKSALKEMEKPLKKKISKRDDDDDDDDDEDEEPVSVKSKKKSVAPAKSKKKSRDDDDDDSDDEDDDDDDREVPMRRSFSGTSTAPKPIAIKPSRKSGKLKSDDEADDDDSDSSSSLRKKMAGGGGLFTLAGFPIGIKLVSISLALLGLFAFAIFHIASNLAFLTSAPGGSTGGGGSPLGLPALTQATPALAGQWELIVNQGQSRFLNQIELHQNGNNLYGQGRDKFGYFIATGNITRQNDVNVMLLKKQFVDRNKHNVGPAIFLQGNIFLDTIPLSAQGQWQFKKKSGSNFGYLNKAKVESYTGDWTAKLMRPMPVDAAGSAMPKLSGSNNSSGGGDVGDGKKFNMIDFMLHNGIFVAIGLGVALVGGSVSLFGPSGAINIWNKQQYIPSQFKSKHGKIRARLAKPLQKGSLPLGRRMEWKWWFPAPWVIKDLAIPPEMRKVNPHMLILGQGGKGKSRLVAKMITHDIESEDRSVFLVDSDGSLVDLITQWIAAHPRGRDIAKRVILIDPTYKEGSVAYNPLNLGDIGDLQTAAASIVDGFKAIYTEPPGSQSQWNAQTADILRNAILLLIGNNKTLIDLPTLLNENDFRDVLLENIEKKKNQRIEFATLLDQWGRYKKLARTDQWITWVEPILNRINPMLSNPRIRSILTKPEGDLDLMDIITKKKILLVRIPQGDFGQDANLLGSLIVSGVKQTCLTLSAVGNKPHSPVALYLDNFDSFIEKNTIEAITSETKKFKIGLIAVTKSLQHLPEDFRNQLIINIGTLITFALSKKDGDLLGPQMFPIDGRKVKNETMANIFNRVNTTPQFELVSDEEKLNIDKVVRQEERTFYCYRMGDEAGLFNLHSHNFDDVPEGKIKKKLLEKMHLSGIRKSDTVD
ncbi:MAG: hypothetical protein QG625_1517 [Cyanobacteriota bacterium erpe_2018_sw_39hr_WHONDRS-SW48-000098_B_bin.30]|nr:hypothetical protein [Cyanobacteriota bacterium erpe_2018_sw_39hr_WHONDRS-SW48-000098_B_bin.30]